MALAPHVADRLRRAVSMSSERQCAVIARQLGREEAKVWPYLSQLGLTSAGEAIVERVIDEHVRARVADLESVGFSGWAADAYIEGFNSKA